MESARLCGPWRDCGTVNRRRRFAPPRPRSTGRRHDFGLWFHSQGVRRRIPRRLLLRSTRFLPLSVTKHIRIRRSDRSVRTRFEHSETMASFHCLNRISSSSKPQIKQTYRESHETDGANLIVIRVPGLDAGNLTLLILLRTGSNRPAEYSPRLLRKTSRQRQN